MGPEFLTKKELEWPRQRVLPALDSDNQEIKRTVSAFVAQHVDVTGPLDTLIESFSEWPRLLRAAAWILAVKGVLRHEIEPVRILQSQHLKEAEAGIVKYVQRQVFPAEILALEKGEQIKDKCLRSLQPVMRDGLLRVGGRLSKSPVPEDFKSPIILPGRSHVATLVISHIHKTTGHTGREYVLSASREKYWITGGRQAVRRVIGNCVTCKRRDAPTCTQRMADLPADRVTPGDPAFSYVGVDYFGPFLVKRGRAREKRYGCVFTCLAVRAIHIEIAHSLESDAFINCLTRFIARRGRPKRIRSDNGTNFVGADRELNHEIHRWNQRRIQGALNDQGIEWLFNVPGASHTGGAWERQIRSIRRILAGLTREQVLTDESLSTLMCMVESVVNNRPITTVSSDPTDMEPLTPNHLLLLRPVKTLPGLFGSNDLYGRKRWCQVQYLADIFWSRWLKEYLPQLQQRRKWCEHKRDLKVGDVVLLADSVLPRNEWSLGRVIRVTKGSDDNVRSVTVKTGKSEFDRPVTKVCLLEGSAMEKPQKDVPFLAVEE